MSSERIRNIKLIIAYDGTNYSGWQIQKDVVTIQGTLLDALKKLLNHKVKITAASRTDAGVHALGQVVNFHTTRDIPEYGILHALNSLLPSDIRIVEATEEPRSFNARSGACGKLYRYTIRTDPVENPLHRLYSWHLPYELDLDSMRRAASHLTGTKDFRSFMASGADPRKKTVLTLEKIAIIEKEDNQIVIDVYGRAFLKQMVRNIVGTLVDIGRGAIEPDEMVEIVEARDRRAAGTCAPARGLCLLRVDY